MSRAACLNSIYELAKRDERVVFIGSDLSANTLMDFKRDFPDRFFMEGIQEQNIISMAAGLAMEGFIPYVNNIASFLTRRCYEQIAVDVCAHNLPVRLCGNGGGLVYAPLGLTHCAIEDIAIMRALPNMTVYCPSDSEDVKGIMEQSLISDSPMYIRLGKDTDPIFPKGKWKFHNLETEILAIGTGIMSYRLAEAAKLLDIGMHVEHFSMVKPFNTTWYDLSKFKMVVIAEEGIVSGGLGTAVMERIADSGIQVPILRFGLPDAFPHQYGEQEDLLETYEVTSEKMAVRIKDYYDAL